MSTNYDFQSDDFSRVDLSKVKPVFGCLKPKTSRRSLYTSRYPIERYLEKSGLRKSSLKIKKRIIDVPPPLREQTMNSCVLETVCTLAAMLNTPLGAFRMPNGGRMNREVMLYDSIEAYTRARQLMCPEIKDVDKLPDDGTYPWLGFEIARTGGLSRMIRPGLWEKPDPRDGFIGFYWCTNLQQLIDVFCLEDESGKLKRLGVGLALEWYRSYSEPEQDETGEYVIDAATGPIDGGHMVTGRGFLDNGRVNGIYFRNSWGKYYPGRVRISFEQMEYQFSRGMEVVVPVDNPWRT
jgi:hypothetical protein